MGGIFCETDLGGTFFETSKSYEGIELFSEDADMLYSVRHIRPCVFVGGASLALFLPWQDCRQMAGTGPLENFLLVLVGESGTSSLSSEDIIPETVT